MDENPKETKEEYSKLKQPDDNGEDESDARQKSLIQNAVDFAQLTLQLKQTLRTGWVRKGIPYAESVADHSWGVTFLVLFLASTFDLSQEAPSPSSINIHKCVQMALIHDLAECMVGDITPYDTLIQTVQEKHELEQNAIHSIASILSSSSTASSRASDLLLNLFQEYEQRSSHESILVKDFDGLDMILQANQYELMYSQSHVNLNDFFESKMPKHFRTKIGKALAKEIHDRRNQRWEMMHATSHYDSNDIGKTVATTTQDKDQNKVEPTTGNLLSSQDKEFVQEYAATCTHLHIQDIQNIVEALRARDKISVGKIQ